MGSCWEFPQEPSEDFQQDPTGNPAGDPAETLHWELQWGPAGSLRGDSAGIPAETPPLLTPKWLINCESTGKPTESPHGHPKGIPSRILLGTTMVQLGFLLRAPQSHTGSPHGCLTRIPSGLLLRTHLGSLFKSLMDSTGKPRLAPRPHWKTYGESIGTPTLWHSNSQSPLPQAQTVTPKPKLGCCEPVKPQNRSLRLGSLLNPKPDPKEGTLHLIKPHPKKEICLQPEEGIPPASNQCPN